MLGLEIIGGYALIKKDAKPNVCTCDLTEFTKHPIRVIEFASDGGALCVAADGKNAGDFNKDDIRASFKCKEISGVICPPTMNELDAMMYIGKCLQRKGGYGSIVKQMVIAASLHRGEFSDGVLWAVEKEEQREQKQKSDHLKDIRTRMVKNQKTTFAERNIVNIIDKKRK